MLGQHGELAHDDGQFAIVFSREGKLHTLRIERFGLGVNRVGTDGNNLSYLGGSVALDYLGQPIVECGAQPQAVTTTLLAEPLKAFRARFPTNLDADSFELRV